MFEQFAFLAVLGLAGYCDLKTLTVPEVLSALLWLIVLFPPFSIAFAGMGFAAVLAITAYYEFLKGEPFWGYGDTLAAGPFIAGIMSFGAMPVALILIIAIGAILAMIALRRKVGKTIGVPFVFILFMAYLFCYLFSLKVSLPFVLN